MTPSRRPGLHSRLVLLAAFTGLLLLLISAALSAISILDSAHQQEQSARRDFLARNRTLLNLDSHLHLFGRSLQRQLPAPALRQLSSRTRILVETYPKPRQPEEQRMLDIFVVALSQQDSLLTSSAEPTRVYPVHLTMVGVVEQLSAWNQNRLGAADLNLLSGFDQLRASLKTLLAILLVSGLLLATGSMLYIVSQEREIRRRYAVEAALSTRLLDAQEQERRAISRELHDEVGQTLGALLVDLARLNANLPANDESLHQAVQHIKSVAERSVASVRNISLLLRPSMLDDLGLVAALEWQAREISRNSSVEVEVTSTAIPDNLPEDIKICAYRIAQEALNNIARHSGARRASLNVAVDSTHLRLSINDDGHGFDPARTKGLGLLGMEERARRLKGRLQISSSPGHGAALTAELPLA